MSSLNNEKKCPAQSFHFPAFHKGKYFIGCNYYGGIYSLDKCDKCKQRRVLEGVSDAE